MGDRPTVYERFKDADIDPEMAYELGQRDATQLFRELEPCGHPKNFLIGDERGNFSCTVCEIARLRKALNHMMPGSVKLNGSIEEGLMPAEKIFRVENADGGMEGECFGTLENLG
jgi:hypothetical protein